MELLDKAISGNSQSLARLISLIEREAVEESEIMKAVFPKIGNAHTIGITGPPGAGKSSLVNKLTVQIRQNGLTAGILAVDPSSPFSGGAVLGDRIRMDEHYMDDGVFIRSMATRGTSGGLPKTAPNVIKLLDASGKDVILVETVGVGQTELDIMESVDTIVVVIVPESGDTIQTMKAGLMEIADIFVVNKSDRPGADYMVVELEDMVMQNPKQTWWQIPVVATQAINDIGIEELYSQIIKHRTTLIEKGQLEIKRQKQRRNEFIRTLEQMVFSKLWRTIKDEQHLAHFLDMVENGKIDPYTASSNIIKNKILTDNLKKKVEAQ